MHEFSRRLDSLPAGNDRNVCKYVALPLTMTRAHLSSRAPRAAEILILDAGVVLFFPQVCTAQLA